MAISCQVNAFQKSVIDQSMTIWAETMVGPAPLQNVIDQSMTVF